MKNIKKLLLIAIMSIGLVDYCYAKDVKSINMRTTITKHTSQGYICTHGLLKNAPNKFKDGERVFIVVYTDNKMIADNNGKKYKVYYYLSEQPVDTKQGNDWRRRMGLVK